MKRVLARALAIGLGTTSILVAAVGLLHTSTGRPVLQAVTRMAHGGCPFGYDKPMSAAERERASANFATNHRGEQRAVSRPALGFILDQNTRAEVLAQMSQHGITCTSAKGYSDLTCNGVPSGALDGLTAYAPPRDLWFTFGAKERLLSVVAISRDAAPKPISDAFAAAQSVLAREAGPVNTSSGNADARALAAGLLNQASAEFRFSNYYALTRATNLGKGFMFTEEYRSLPD
jgi:hypothetical protein